MKKILLMLALTWGAGCKKDDVPVYKSGIDKTIGFDISPEYDHSTDGPQYNIEIELYLTRDNPDRNVEVWDSILPRKQTKFFFSFIVEHVIRNTNSTTGIIGGHYIINYYRDSIY